MDKDEAGFVGEVESLLYLFPELGNVEQHFKQFNEFSVNCCKPMGTVLMSQQEVCPFCGKVLAVEPTTHVVVIYHEQRGSYLGSRITKCCRACKVYEHYGYWTLDGKRQFNEDSLQILLLTKLQLCTCHRLAPGVGPRANQGDCKMGGAKLRISPRGGGI